MTKNATYTIPESMMRTLVAIALAPPIKRSKYAYKAVVPWHLIESLREQLGLTEEKLKGLKNV